MKHRERGDERRGREGREGDGRRDVGGERREGKGKEGDAYKLKEKKSRES